MASTQQIIENIVRTVIKSELSEVKTDLALVKTDIVLVKTDLAEVKTGLSALERKVDTLNSTVIDFAGKMLKFDQEQAFLSGHMANRTDRIEKLETKVFGSSQSV